MIAKAILTFETLVIIAIVFFILQKVRLLKSEVAGFLFCGFVALGVVIIIVVLTVRVAFARDFGQWGNSDPAERAWYQALMQPDNPAVSCCGEADAYWADSFEVDGDRYVAIITDPRPDEPLRRKHVDVGTKIVVPNQKLKYDQSNPTGHGVIFLGHGNTDTVYCYVAPGGV